VKTRVIPVVIWATGIISRLFGKCLTNIPRKHETEEPQKKTAILGTAHILRKVLVWKYKIFRMGNNITCTIYCNYRIAATLHTLEKWFISGARFVNTLHKDDKY
jgi:hypothetical protein